ncbi:MAG TPA: hypothetical protein VF661_02440 [Actinomycetales bacterium]
MTFYLVVAALSAGLLPIARRRSRGSMTRYVLYTGAPAVLVLMLAAALVAAALASRDEVVARQVFTGGLIAAGIAQFILLRRTQTQDDVRRPTD